MRRRRQRQQRHRREHRGDPQHPVSPLPLGLELRPRPLKVRDLADHFLGQKPNDRVQRNEGDAVAQELVQSEPDVPDGCFGSSREIKRWVLLVVLKEVGGGDPLEHLGVGVVQEVAY